MSIAIRLQVSNQIRTGLYERLHKAYGMGQLRRVRRIHAILFILDGIEVADIANRLNLSPQTIYNYVKAFILNHLESL